MVKKKAHPHPVLGLSILYIQFFQAEISSTHLFSIFVLSLLKETAAELYSKVQIIGGWAFF